jgi:DNA polymerase-1
MKHICFQKNTKYKIALLVLDSALVKYKLHDYYVSKMVAKGISEADVIAFSLKQTTAKKVSAADVKEHLVNLMPAMNKMKVEYAIVTDSTYFKKMTGCKKAEVNLGYIMPCVLPGYEHINILLAPIYTRFIYNDTLAGKVDMVIDALHNTMCGTFQNLGSGIIHKADYLEKLPEIEAFLDSLHQYPRLSCDIEAFSLEFSKAGIGTIGFAWDTHNGGVILCDYFQLHKPVVMDEDGQMVEAVIKDGKYPVGTIYGEQINNFKVKMLLKKFFETYEGTLVFHKANYDLKVLTYELWMKNLLDTEGMIEGIKVLTKNFDDTIIITYLATNNTMGNNLRLKDNTHEFAGNYAQEDIKDIRKISKKDLLKYNLIDCLCTNYLWDKNYPKVLADNQLDVYNTIMKPSVGVLLQVELTGVPLDMKQVLKAKAKLNLIKDKWQSIIMNSKEVVEYTDILRKKALDKDFEARRNKAKKPEGIKEKDISQFGSMIFNPNSTTQLAGFLYGHLGYPVLRFTKSKAPSTDNKALKQILVSLKGKPGESLMEAFCKLAELGTILSTFIEAFEKKSILKSDGMHYLHGSFHLGGTVSGRLSSSDPNLMNLPNKGNPYAADTKACCVAPPGWLIIGADFTALEAKISALTTKDPNKLKIYEDGYDSHCLMAYTYYGDEMPDIVDTVESINSIEILYPDFRKESKQPTFLLTYKGTWMGLMKNLGFSEEKSKKIEANYLKLYKVSTDWVEVRIQEASVTGYVTLAFGLRLRTPRLAKTMLGSSKIPYEVQSEVRTAGNALGQGYGMLNNRAAIEFQKRTWDSPYRLDIRPFAHIHDSQMFLVRDKAGVVEWFNNNLIECMEWQQLPELQHPVVKLGGKTSVFYPSWAEEYTIENGVSLADLLKSISDQMLAKEDAHKKAQSTE